MPPLAVTLGAALLLVGTFLPWVRSGAVDRSSYEVFDLVERLGFSPDGPIGWALRVWPLVPLLLVLGVVAQWWPGGGRLADALRRVLPLVTAVYAGGTALAVRLAPDAGLLRVGVGPSVSLLGGVVMLAAASWSIAVSRRGSAASAAS
jgi:hypothetical protein